MGGTRRRPLAAPSRARRSESRRPRSRGRFPGSEESRRSLSLLQRRCELRDLAIDVAILGKRPARAPIPIARVAEISFHDVHDAVRPASELGVVLLHDRVRFLPLAFFEMTYRGSKCHGLPYAIR